MVVISVSSSQLLRPFAPPPPPAIRPNPWVRLPHKSLIAPLPSDGKHPSERIRPHRVLPVTARAEPPAVALVRHAAPFTLERAEGSSASWGGKRAMLLGEESGFASVERLEGGRLSGQKIGMSRKQRHTDPQSVGLDRRHVDKDQIRVRSRHCDSKQGEKCRARRVKRVRMSGEASVQQRRTSTYMPMTEPIIPSVSLSRSPLM